MFTRDTSRYKVLLRALCGQETSFVLLMTQSLRIRKRHEISVRTHPAPPIVVAAKCRRLSATFSGTDDVLFSSHYLLAEASYCAGGVSTQIKSFTYLTALSSA
jgi:hypothetical protein